MFSSPASPVYLNWMSNLTSSQFALSFWPFWKQFFGNSFIDQWFKATGMVLSGRLSYIVFVVANLAFFFAFLLAILWQFFLLTTDSRQLDWFALVDWVELLWCIDWGSLSYCSQCNSWSQWRLQKWFLVIMIKQKIDKVIHLAMVDQSSANISLWWKWQRWWWWKFCNGS